MMCPHSRFAPHTYDAAAAASSQNNTNASNMADRNLALVPASTAATTASSASAAVQQPDSYSVEGTDFSENLRALLLRAINLGGAAKPRYAEGCRKILTALDRVSGDSETGLEPFKTAFARFVAANPVILEPLVGDDDVVHDALFKRTDRGVAPGGGEAASAGLVVYYNLDAPHLASACVAVSEIYNAAVERAHAGGGGSSTDMMTPTLVMLDFYAVCAHSVPADSPHREALIRNLADLCEVAEAISPGSGPGVRARAAAVPPIVDGMSSFLSALSGGAVAPQQMTDAFSDVQNVVKNLIDKITETGPPVDPDGSIDPAVLLGRIGDVFKSPDIQSQIARTARNASEIFRHFAPPAQPTTSLEPGGEPAEEPVE